MTLTYTLAETKVQNDPSSMIKIKYSMIIHQYTYTRVTLINTTWWQGKEYRDVNMTCTQECAIVVGCHHSMNMHDVSLGASSNPRVDQVTMKASKWTHAIKEFQ